MTTAEGLLRALAEGDEAVAWEHARALAKGVVEDATYILANAILDGGPFAMRKAEELAETVLGEGVEHGRVATSAPRPRSEQ